MKTPKARRLPSGSWTVQLRIDGQSISITKPTEKQAVAEAMAVKAGIKQAARTPQNARTLAAAIEDYIKFRENVLSPSTIAGYRVIARNRFPQLQRVRICDLTPQRWQSAVNAEARIVGAKTLKNSAMFIQSVVRDAGGPDLSARLPQVVPRDLPWLAPDQIPTFLEAIRGNQYEIPMLLALSGLRRSEIVALRWADIDLQAGQIRVHGAAVMDDDGKVVFKDTNKNQSSNRIVPFIIPQLRAAAETDQHRQTDYVYPKYNNVLRKNIDRICAANGLPQVGVHGLRRSFASLCYHLGISEEVTMMAGGWSELRTMRKIYTKVSEQDIRNQSRRFDDFFQNANGNANAF